MARGAPAAAWVRRVVRAALAAAGGGGRPVSVFLTGDRAIRAVNKRHLKHDYATDVIAFPLEGDVPPPGAPDLLGDVVVSVETARRAARELDLPFREELARYLVHGTLHLLGHDDKKEPARSRMHRVQEAVLERFFKELG